MAKITEIPGFEFPTPETCERMGCRYEVRFDPRDLLSNLVHTHGRTGMTIVRQTVDSIPGLTSDRQAVLIGLAAYAHQDDYRLGFGDRSVPLSERMKREIQQPEGQNARIEQMKEYLQAQARLSTPQAYQMSTTFPMGTTGYQMGMTSMSFEMMQRYQDAYRASRISVSNPANPFASEATDETVVDRISPEAMERMLAEEPEDD